MKSLVVLIKLRAYHGLEAVVVQKFSVFDHTAEVEGHVVGGIVEDTLLEVRGLVELREGQRRRPLVVLVETEEDVQTVDEAGASQGLVARGLHGWG